MFSLLTLMLNTFVVILALSMCFCKILNWQKFPKSRVCLFGKTAIVTGANKGIGFELALSLAMRGCRVIIACRNDLELARQKIIDITKNPNIVGIHLDLTSLSSVRKFAKHVNETEKRLDILIHNAVMLRSDMKETEDGLNPMVQVSHFGPFLLTHLLVELMKTTGPGRIIFVSSLLVYFHNLTLETLNPPNGDISLAEVKSVYENNKLCNIISAIGFSNRLKGYGITVNAIHPGLVATSIFESIRSPDAPWQQKMLDALTMTPVAKTPEQGAFGVVDLATEDSYQYTSGEFLYDGISLWLPARAKDAEFSKKVWELSEEFVKLRPEELL